MTFVSPFTVTQSEFLDHNPLKFNMTWKLFLFMLGSASCHLFVGYPPPLRWHQDITLLIMPLNGDPNAYPPIGQQSFPCKGFHADIDGPEGDPVASWTVGQDVTFSYVLRCNGALTLTTKGSLIAPIPQALRCTVRERLTLEAHAK